MPCRIQQEDGSIEKGWHIIDDNIGDLLNDYRREVISSTYDRDRYNESVTYSGSRPRVCYERVIEGSINGFLMSIPGLQPIIFRYDGDDYYNRKTYFSTHELRGESLETFLRSLDPEKWFDEEEPRIERLVDLDIDFPERGEGVDVHLEDMIVIQTNDRMKVYNGTYRVTIGMDDVGTHFEEEACPIPYFLEAHPIELRFEVSDNVVNGIRLSISRATFKTMHLESVERKLEVFKNMVNAIRDKRIVDYLSREFGGQGVRDVLLKNVLKKK